MAISTYVRDGSVLFKIRAQSKSKRDPGIRFTKQISGIKSEAEARRVESRVAKELRDLVAVQEAKRAAAGRTWSGVLDHWYEAQLKIRVPFGGISRITLDDSYRGMKKMMLEFNNILCSEITSLDLMRVFNSMAERGISSGHRQKMRTKIKAVFEHGIRSGLINVVRNPVYDLALRKTEERKPEILTIGEIRRLVELAFATQHDWRQVWALALLTGMRNGELYALQWSDIDWEHRLITVARSFNCRARAISPTKAGYWRDVPISQDCLRLLHELRQAHGAAQFVLPRLARWDHGIQAAVLRTFCLEHGLPSVRFHTLRACFGTQLLRQGVPAAVVMKISGWKDLKTMQRYVRLAGVEVAGATDKLSVLPPEEIVANVVAFRPRG